MSVLPAGRPLRRVVPDLDVLLEDPHTYLSEGAVVIGPRRMYGLAALFGLPVLALVVSGALADPPDMDRLPLGAGLLAGALVWLAWSLLLRGHQLVLAPEGVEVFYRGSIVWAPWALFNVDGGGFVPDSDSPRAGLILPVAAEAVPFIELRRDGQVLAYGKEVRGPQWELTVHGEVVLPARYDVAAGELMALLVQLGQRLGRQLPRTPPPREAPSPEGIEESVPPDPAGWITVPLSRLNLPPGCCACGAPMRTALPCHVTGRWAWLMGPLLQTDRRLSLAVPICSECEEKVRASVTGGGARGLVVGLAVAAVPVIRLLVLQFGQETLLLALGVLAVGAPAGYLVGTALVRDLPVRLRRYDPTRGTVEFRFRNPDYAARVLMALREQGEGRRVS